MVVFGRVLALPNELLPDPFVSVLSFLEAKKIKLLFVSIEENQFLSHLLITLSVAQI